MDGKSGQGIVPHPYRQLEAEKTDPEGLGIPADRPVGPSCSTMRSKKPRRSGPKTCLQKNVRTQKTSFDTIRRRRSEGADVLTRFGHAAALRLALPRRVAGAAPSLGRVAAVRRRAARKSTTRLTLSPLESVILKDSKKLLKSDSTNTSTLHVMISCISRSHHLFAKTHVIRTYQVRKTHPPGIPPPYEPPGGPPMCPG